MDIFQKLVDQTRDMIAMSTIVARNMQLAVIEAHVEKLRAQHPDLEQKIDEFVGIDGLQSYLAMQYVDPQRNLDDIIEEIDHDFLD